MRTLVHIQGVSGEIPASSTAQPGMEDTGNSKTPSEAETHAARPEAEAVSAEEAGEAQREASESRSEEEDPNYDGDEPSSSSDDDEVDEVNECAALKVPDGVGQVVNSGSLWRPSSGRPISLNKKEREEGYSIDE